MPRWFKRGLPRRVNQKQAQSLLEENGWTRAIGGKHSVKMTKEGRRPITLPYNKGETYPVGLSEAILKQAGLK